jgi:hypothetical protein
VGSAQVPGWLVGRYTLGVQAYLWGYPLYAYALTDAAAERAGAA